MKDTLYKQCRLRRETDTGYEEMTSWLPERFAVVGKSLRLRDETTKEWSAGWRVLEAHGPPRTYEQATGKSYRFGMPDELEEW